MENQPNIKDFKQQFYVKGLSCATCVKHVEQALNLLDTVKFATVNLATETGLVISETEIPFETLKKAVQEAGYDLETVRTEEVAQKRLKDARSNLILSWGLTIPLAVLMFFHMGGANVPFFPWVELVFSAIVVFGTGRKTIRGAWIALIHYHSNMDTLIFLGSATAWFTTVLHLSGLHISSFGSIGAMIVSIHLTGRFIESYLRDRAAKDVKALVQLQSKEARVKVKEEWVFLPIDVVKPGSEVKVLPSERIPLDGEVIEGSSSVDESMITGEFLPSLKAVGSPLTGGSLNLNAPITFRVTKAGKELFLSQLIAMIQESQGTKVPIQALADRLTLRFVPVVIALSILAGVVWFFGFNSFLPFLHGLKGFFPWILIPMDALSFSLFVFVATIVIACPCALGLAIPMALIAASGLSAKKGLIIRNAEAIQTAGKIDTILLDKTGTLTVGKPCVLDTTVDNSLLSAVATLESLSAHPLAKAISEYALPQNASTEHTAKEKTVFQRVVETAGEGIEGDYDKGRLFVGKPADYAMYPAWASEGLTIVEVRLDGKKKGAFAIADRIRPDSKPAILQLRQLGLEIILATGDHQQTALHVSQQLDNIEFKSGLKPADKLALIQEYQKNGKKVLMVGDGLNDGPALAAADIGVAMGSGTDLAMNNADIIIVKGGITGVVDSLRISKRTFTIIRQNLFWAFVYNVIAIPAAMMGILHPAIAETAMAFSSITVMLNSLRLRGRESVKR